jgi:hypothetical protein
MLPHNEITDKLHLEFTAWKSGDSRITHPTKVNDQIFFVYELPNGGKKLCWFNIEPYEGDVYHLVSDREFEGGGSFVRILGDKNGVRKFELFFHKDEVDTQFAASFKNVLTSWVDGKALCWERIVGGYLTDYCNTLKGTHD